MKQTFKAKGLLLVAAIAVIAVLLGRYDMEISNYFYNPDSLLGMWINVVGEWPNSLALIFSGIVLFGGRDRWDVRPVVSALYTVPVFLGTGILVIYTYRYAKDAYPNFLVAIPIIIAASLLLLRIFAYGEPNQYRKLRGIAQAALWMGLFSIASINVLKFFWGRVRYVDILAGAGSFSAWYLPQGVTGHHSFPSGHVANACTSLILWLFAERAGSQTTAAILWIMPIAWILLTAVGRIVAGAHFVSDVLTSVLICTMFFQMCRRNAMIDSVRHSGHLM